MNDEKRKVLTLCIIYQHPRVLLGMKKRGFGEGRWNGFGGKVQAGESVEEAARREVEEEASLKILNMEKAGVIDFRFVGEPGILEVHIFRADKFTGEPQESDEMRPVWFNISDIPFDSMWPDDRLWFSLFLAGKKFKGEFLFQGDNKIVEYKLEELT